jgi:hypothetical protein
VCAQEPEAVRQHLEHAFGEDEPALLCLRLEDLKNQLLFAHAGRSDHVQVLGDRRELLDAHLLELGDVQPRAAALRRWSRRLWGAAPDAASMSARSSSCCAA